MTRLLRESLAMALILVVGLLLCGAVAFPLPDPEPQYSAGNR